MAAEATFTIPAAQFPLGTVFDRLPSVTVEFERIIPAQDVVVPYFWVRGTTVDDVADSFAEHPGVEDIRFVDSVDDQHLLRVEWALEYDGVLRALSEGNVALIEAVGTSDQWTFETRADSRQDISDFQNRCREYDVPIRLMKLHALTPLESDIKGTLTDTQLETLVLAYDRGYFNSPRDVTMAELGAELGISQQAVASRIRRGLDQLLETALADVISNE
ncbi:helix-turn-helix domain-containing protein [Natronorubrum sediminis]|nr:helix-turn-helix domain-containing protein [Natronorubrum sediminis]